MTFGILVFLASAVTFGCAGEVTILLSPQNLQFEPVSSVLQASTLQDVISASMGYTTEVNSHWNGLSVSSPFLYPSAALLIGVETSGSPLTFDGVRYNLTEDEDLTTMFTSLHDRVSKQGVQPTHFTTKEVIDVAAKVPSTTSSHLNPEAEPDRSFLVEVDALPSLVKTLLANHSAVSSGGQDFAFLRLTSFGHLVTMYGDDSDQVLEAKTRVRSAVSQFTKAASAFYGEVLVAAITTDRPVAPLRRLLQADAPPPSSQLNLAEVYGENYPVTFNIILLLSITLAVSVMAASAAIATMDPGRDSIIYRMTTMRMKKDN